MISKAKHTKGEMEKCSAREKRRRCVPSRDTGTGAAVFAELSDTNWKFNAGILIATVGVDTQYRVNMRR